MVNLEIDRFTAYPEKVQELLKARLEKAGQFGSLRTRHLEDDIETYSQQTKKILQPGPLEKVWELYTQRRPDKTWVGPVVNFLFCFSKRDQRLFYSGQEDMPLFHVGMQNFCWLNLLGPRLIVGFEILQMDSERHVLEISYVEGGLYRGTQFLTFSESQGQTQVIHKSYFRSDSRFRDAVLYPFFHNMTTGEHHQYMKKLLVEG